MAEEGVRVEEGILELLDRHRQVIFFVYESLDAAFIPVDPHPVKRQSVLEAFNLA